MITAYYVLALALIFLYLTIRIIKIRRTKLIGLGDAGDKDLIRAVRAHGHFTEFVPFLLIVMVLLEMANAPAWAIHLYGVALVISRIAHAQGLYQSTGTSAGRMAGMMLTFALLILGPLGLVVLHIL